VVDEEIEEVDEEIGVVVDLEVVASVEEGDEEDL
jgi:hypothetical protein